MQTFVLWVEWKVYCHSTLSVFLVSLFLSSFFLMVIDDNVRLIDCGFFMLICIL